MLASVPLRPSQLSKNVVVKPELLYLFPGDTVPPSRRSLKEVKWGIEGEWTPTICAQSEHIDAFWRPGQVIPTNQITQFDYLNFVRNIIEYWMIMKTPVSMPWVQEILRVEAAIRERRNGQLNGPLPLGKTWAADVWDFKLPEYDHLNMSVWDETTGWVRVQD